MSDTPEKESALFGVSIRGWVTLILTICFCSVCGWVAYASKDLPEPLTMAVMLALGFYYGQKKKETTQ